MLCHMIMLCHQCCHMFQLKNFLLINRVTSVTSVTYDLYTYAHTRVRAHVFINIYM